MIFRLFFSTLKQGIIGFIRNINTAFASIISNSCVFILLGIITILILSANNVTKELQASVNQMQVFIKDGLTLEQLGELDKKIRSRPEVLSLKYISKEQGLKELIEEWGDDGYLLESLEENPLQDSYELTLKEISMASSLTEALSEMPEIDGANYHEELMTKTMNIARYIKLGGFALMLILIGISVVIISNTTKIAIASRTKEINIMKYIGATNEYIKGPFIVEAMIIGSLSAFVAVVIIRVVYGYFYESASTDLYNIFTYSLVSPKLLVEDISVVFATIGLGIGAIGSILSLRKHVRV